MNKVLLSLLAVVNVILFIGVFIIDPIPASSNSQSQSQQPFTSLTPQIFNQAITSGEYELIDIRTLGEYLQGSIPDASQVDFYQTQVFSSYLDKLDKKKKYLIFCKSGNRTRQALQIMKQKGFTNVWDLQGGYTAWQASGL